MSLPAGLRAAIDKMWPSEASEREAGANAIRSAAVDMVDTRSALPALTLLLSDQVPSVRHAALRALEYRADMGADVGMAVPALLLMQEEPDSEMRRLVHAALRCADQRLRGLLRL